MNRKQRAVHYDIKNAKFLISDIRRSDQVSTSESEYQLKAGFKATPLVQLYVEMNISNKVKDAIDQLHMPIYGQLWRNMKAIEFMED